MAIYGDTSGTLSGNEHGTRQVLTGDEVYGDASIIQDAAKGGNDGSWQMIHDSALCSITAYTYTTIDPQAALPPIPRPSTPRARSSGITSTVAASSTASSTAAAPTRRSISQAALTPGP